MTRLPESDRQLGLEIEQEMIGPRCAECGGCDINVAVKWAGEKYGWCSCEETDNDN